MDLGDVFGVWLPKIVTFPRRGLAIHGFFPGMNIDSVYSTDFPLFSLRRKLE